MKLLEGTGEVYDMYNDYLESGEIYLSKIGISDVIYHHINEQSNKSLSLMKTYLLILENGRK